MVPWFFKALIKADPTQKRFDVNVVLINSTVELAKERITQRRLKKGMSTDFNTDYLRSEATGLRQRNALNKYSLYPKKLFEVQAKPDFSEQQIILDYIESVINPCSSATRSGEEQRYAKNP